MKLKPTAMAIAAEAELNPFPNDPYHTLLIFAVVVLIFLYALGWHDKPARK